MDDLKRMKVVVAHYHDLQGLRMLPWYLWILAFSAVNPILGLPQGQLDFQCLIFVPGFAVAWILSKLVGNYYDRAFGQVKSLPPRKRQNAWLAGIAFVVIAYSGFFIDSLQRLPLSVFGLTMAVALFVLWWVSGRFLIHNVVTAALFAVTSLLPLMGIPAGGHWISLLDGFILPIAFSVIMGIGSLLGHIMLVGQFKSLAQEGV